MATNARMTPIKTIQTMMSARNLNITSVIMEKTIGERMEKGLNKVKESHNEIVCRLNRR